VSTARWHPEDRPAAGSEADEEHPPAGEGLPPTEEPSPAQLAEGPAVTGDEAVPSPPEPGFEPGPEPGSEPGPEPEPEPGPEPVIPVSESSHRQTPAAVPFGGPDPAASAAAAQRPEVLAGAAFAGGLALAMLLRRVLG